ncbi:hypothetical protein L596_028874 [Steinernema carpocapsae]|uniref:Homeobox domain-containing protein n=1 Tax=Steinernema carpocapsae TaxID=34508 RepID=A0A4U5LZN8_STECR|nr:hypothetical protein L596_028874 [Steinernema carpocapsae]
MRPTKPVTRSQSVPSKGISKQTNLLSEDQLFVLNEWFSTVKFVTPEERRFIAKSTGLSETRVFQWFQRERLAEKRLGIILVPECERQNKESTSKAPESPNQKRLTSLQLCVLKKAFHENPSPSNIELQNLSKQTKTPVFQLDERLENRPSIKK